MKESADYHRFPWRIFAYAVLLAAGWWVFVGWSGWRADLAESNLQANLIRITRYLRAESPDVVLVGSSIGGRLLPEYFELEGREFHNLGLDGSRPLFGFDVLRRHASLPRVVLLETAALFQPLDGNDAVLAEAMDATTARLGARIPFFRPELRPSSVIYEQLKTWREGAVRGMERLALPAQDDVATALVLPETYGQVRSAVSELRAAGVEVVLVKVPAGEGWASPVDGAARRLAGDEGLTVWEPGSELHAAEGNVLRFSDGLHLDAPSARKVGLWLSRRLSGSGGAPVGE